PGQTHDRDRHDERRDQPAGGEPDAAAEQPETIEQQTDEVDGGSPGMRREHRRAEGGALLSTLTLPFAAQMGPSLSPASRGRGARRRRRMLRIVLGFVLALLATAAQAADGFYADKTVRILTSAVGSSYDSYARLVARHLPKHVAGGVKAVIVQ